MDTLQLPLQYDVASIDIMLAGVQNVHLEKLDGRKINELAGDSQGTMWLIQLRLSGYMNQVSPRDKAVDGFCMNNRCIIIAKRAKSGRIATPTFKTQ